MSDALRDQLQQTLGDSYTIVRELARGGMSRVYLADDRTLGRQVVVKALSPDLAAEVNVERFAREVQLAGRLQHPHIVPLISAGNAAATPFFIMPFVAGISLRERLQKGGELPIDETVRVLRDVATALEYAHENGIVHRDIKPENILLSGGSAVVTDFGVAKAISAATVAERGAALTGTGIALGTPTYMAPEQAAADPTMDSRADIYAWGIVAYEMLTGAAPFAGRSPTSMIAAHIAEPVPPIHRPGVPHRLTELVMRTLRKRPADRPQTAQELVTELDAITSAGVSSAEVQSGRRPTTQRWIAAAAALLILVLGWSFLRVRGGAAPGSAVKRIAVMPFANASGSADDEYFADGMSEELGAALGRVRGVQVASHSSVFSFKGKDVDVRDVGRKLAVDAVLEGRVRRAGQRLRVTAELTDVSNGLSLWSDSYERDAKDVFAVQDDIARAIASALELKFSEKVSPTLPAEVQGTEDPQAYDLYLRGRYFWHQRGPENLRNAIRFFEEAITHDPKFARAYAGLASAYVLLPEYSDLAPADAGMRAERAAAAALQYDSTVAEAYLARGLSDAHDWKWTDAAAAYHKALALEPRNATAHQWYGELLYVLGDADSSIAQMRQARALDPLAPIAASALAYALYDGRHFEEAAREGERAAELAPKLGLIRRVLAQTYVALHDSTRALASARLAVALDPERSSSIGLLAYVAGVFGHRDEALAALRKLESKPSDSVTHLPFMLAYTGLGENEKALTAFERMVDNHEREFAASSFVLDVSFDPLKSSPRWKAAVARAGLADVAP